jgi:hypothetical protein
VWKITGALWNPGAHTDNLQILILNDDTGFNFSSTAFAGSGLVDNATLALLRELPTSTRDAVCVSVSAESVERRACGSLTRGASRL